MKTIKNTYSTYILKTTITLFFQLVLGLIDRLLLISYLKSLRFLILTLTINMDWLKLCSILINKKFLFRFTLWLIMEIIIYREMNTISIISAYFILFMEFAINIQSPQKQKKLSFFSECTEVIKENAIYDISNKGESTTDTATRRNRTLSDFLNDDEKWLDLLDHGYFLCNKEFRLLYSNKKGKSIMNGLALNFKEFTEKLVETHNSKSCLKRIIERFFNYKTKNETEKIEFTILGNSQDEDVSSFKAELLCNYESKVMKLSQDFVLIILKKSNKFSTLALSRKL